MITTLNGFPVVPFSEIKSKIWISCPEGPGHYEIHMISDNPDHRKIFSDYCYFKFQLPEIFPLSEKFYDTYNRVTNDRNHLAIGFRKSNASLAIQDEILIHAQIIANQLVLKLEIE